MLVTHSIYVCIASMHAVHLYPLPLTCSGHAKDNTSPKYVHRNPSPIQPSSFLPSPCTVTTLSVLVLLRLLLMGLMLDLLARLPRGLTQLLPRLSHALLGLVSVGLALLLALLKALP